MGSHSEEQIIEAFQMMWGTYPEPVRLIHRTERIVAGNDAYLNTTGPSLIGTKCRDAKPAELHKGCMYAKALKTGEAQTKDSEVMGVAWHTYWLPVQGEEDYFIHFTNGILETYAKMAEAAAAQQTAEEQPAEK